MTKSERGRLLSKNPWVYGEPPGQRRPIVSTNQRRDTRKRIRHYRRKQVRHG